jgi:hypothetical protein
LLLAVSIFYNFFWEDIPRQVKVVLPKTEKIKVAAKDEVLLTGLLGQDAPEFSSIQRNVFEFNGSDPMIAAEMPPAPMEAEVIPETQELPDVRYLAYYLEKGSKNVPIGAIINGGRIYVGVEGDILAGKYKILQIDDEFILLKYLPDGRTIRLPMGKESGVVVDKTESASNR